MKTISFLIFTLVCAHGFADAETLYKCHNTELSSPTELFIEKDEGVITALLKATLPSGARVEQAYSLKDTSALEVVRFVDTETSGSSFLFNGPKQGVKLVQAMIGVNVIQANMTCESF